MSPPASGEAVAAAEDLALLSETARLLFENGETTRRIVSTIDRLGRRLGLRVSVYPGWGELILRTDAPDRTHVIAASPVGVNMSKVAATTGVADAICDGRLSSAAARSELEKVSHLPEVPLTRFAAMAGAGAAALGVIFGADNPAALVLIAIIAAAGAGLRRWLAGISSNTLVQPFCAALLAGAAGALAVRFGVSSPSRLVALCPCMVLVPGPHFLNGTIDLVRARIALGLCRVAYASLISVAICTGLIIGLSLVGVSLPASARSLPVPLGYDVVAAGIAVAAYGTFFTMPWRMLPIPILIGMGAHAARWAVISLTDKGPVAGALVACVLVGCVVTPIADRLRLTFAAFAFASVVSLMPGVYLFRMAGGLVALTTLGANAPPDLLVEAAADGAAALLIILVMTLGLIVPKMCIEHFDQSLAEA